MCWELKSREMQDLFNCSVGALINSKTTSAAPSTANANGVFSKKLFLFYFSSSPGRWCLTSTSTLENKKIYFPGGKPDFSRSPNGSSRSVMSSVWEREQENRDEERSETVKWPDKLQSNWSCSIVVERSIISRACLEWFRNCQIVT